MRMIESLDPRGFYDHLTGPGGMEGPSVKGEKYVRGEDGTLLRNKGELNW